MNKNFMKFAFASALAFAGTLSVNAQITAPEWAVDQNATIQHVGENMSVGDRFFSADEVLLFEITSTTSTSDYTYVVKVVGINTNKVADLTELTIPFSDFDNNITSKIATVDPIAVYDPSAMNTAVSSDLTGIKTLTVGYSEADDHLATTGFGITSIANNAFSALTGLTQVITYCSEPPTMATNAFPTAIYNKKLIVPNIKGNKEYQGKAGGLFANATGWKNFMYNKKIYVGNSTYFFGDFDKNGTLNSMDPKRMLTYQNAIDDGEEYSGSVNSLSLDINGDGKFTSTDVKKLLSIYNEIEDM